MSEQLSSQQEASTDVLFDERDGIARITLNRPTSMNAITQSMREGVRDGFLAAQATDDVKVVVLTGSGDAFCGGGDLSVLKSKLDQPPEAPSTDFQITPTQNEAIEAIAACSKPVIAAINGPVAGGGLGMALACDIRVACDDAKFSLAFARLGLCPEWGMSYFLPRLVGEQKAKELFWLAPRLSAEEAFDLGLVSELVARDALVERVDKLASEIASRPPVAVTLSKRVLSRSLDCDLSTMLSLESWARNICTSTEDFREAVRALAEKRKPLFKGH
ncbi:MAG: enoyl-CoA hydratase [Pseudomonadota bacterium]